MTWTSTRDITMAAKGRWKEFNHLLGVFQKKMEMNYQVD